MFNDDIRRRLASLGCNDEASVGRLLVGCFVWPEQLAVVGAQVRGGKGLLVPFRREVGRQDTDPCPREGAVATAGGNHVVSPCHCRRGRSPLKAETRVRIPLEPPAPLYTPTPR